MADRQDDTKAVPWSSLTLSLSRKILEENTTFYFGLPKSHVVVYGVFSSFEQCFPDYRRFYIIAYTMLCTNICSRNAKEKKNSGAKIIQLQITCPWVKPDLLSVWVECELL